MENKTVLLLGGTGTLSSAIRNKAISCGYSVAIMNRGSKNNNLPKGVEVFLCDFHDVSRMKDFFGNRCFDVVVDFLSRKPSDIEIMYPVFADRCRQYIFISSACVFCREEQGLPVTENSRRPNLNWSYNVQKYEAELKLEELSSRTSSYYTIVRPYITYDDERLPLGIAPAYKYHRTLIERFKAGKPWFTWDDGQTVTTITHTLDFSNMVVGLFGNQQSRNTSFNVVGDYSCTQQELIATIIEKLASSSKIIKIPADRLSLLLPEYKDMLKGDRTLNAKFDNTRVKEAVPLQKFAVDINTGIERVIKHWNEDASYLYDYEFEARIDRMLSKYTRVHFVKYPNATLSDVIKYYVYRYVPIRYANRLSKLLKLK